MKGIYKCLICGEITEEPTHCGARAKPLLSSSSREKLSRLMSYLLRHNPGIVKLKMDKEGWVNIDELVNAIRSRWRRGSYSWVAREHILAVAALDPKGRFQVEEDRIRTRYGHNRELKVQIKYEADGATKILYHGTTAESLESIMSQGIKPMSRAYVHLTTDPNDAYEVAARHGAKIVILMIDADCLRKHGYHVLIATLKIRLAKYVPPQCITIFKRQA